MIKIARQKMIISIIEESEALSISALVRRLGRVSAVTVRRDISELADKGLLLRTHGGAARLAGVETLGAEGPADTIRDEIGQVDAVILPPIEGRSADTLRSMVRRRNIPFLAESAPQDGGVYIGPDNYAAARELGHRAGRSLSGVIKTARILLVSLDRLPNTRSRCDGFVKGFSERFGGPIESWRIDGRGSFRIALAASLDAFAVHPDINVAFGVNDHSILAALEASDTLGANGVHGFGVGGEGGAMFEALQANRKLRACAALFPEVVGILAVDLLDAALAGEALPAEAKTPHAILTPENIGEFYRREPDGWVLEPAAQARLHPGSQELKPARAPRVIGFIPHYPAHDWYRNMIRSMRMRAEELGHELRIAPPQAGIARELVALRRSIALAAASRIQPGETIILCGGGETILALADEIPARRDLTVVTNSLDVMQRLHAREGVKLIVASGEYQKKHNCLVGPSVAALFETLRVSKAFLCVDGLTARFGPSMADERLALAARRFIEASRETIVLADHSSVGNDASHRIVPIRSVTEVITDSGSLPVDRLALSAAGVRVTVAEDGSHASLSPLRRRPAEAEPENL
jgi:DeoR/GlpR family transcriptional regulator of sugar metabolism